MQRAVVYQNVPFELALTGHASVRCTVLCVCMCFILFITRVITEERGLRDRGNCSIMTGLHLVYDFERILGNETIAVSCFCTM